MSFHLDPRRRTRRGPRCLPSGGRLGAALVFASATAAMAQVPAAPPAAAPASVAASSASSPASTLPPVVVRGEASRERATGPVDGYAARRSGTATRTDTPLADVPQSISVITAEQVRDQNSQTMQEVLRYTAGVRAETYGLDNRGDYFSLRGGSEGSTLLDGLRLPLTGFWGVVRNEPYAFERIEVLRGPASVIAGQNGPGGVVNLVSKRPQAEAAREATLQLGTRDHKLAALDLTGPVLADGSLLYRFVGLQRDSGTQVRFADEERTYLAPSLTWRPLRGTSIDVYAEYQRDRSKNLNGFFPIEGTLNESPNGRIPTDTFVGEPDWDRYGGTRRRLGYRLEQALGDRWTLRHDLRHDRVDGDIRTMYAAWYLGYADATGAADPTGRFLNRLWYHNVDRARITSGDLLLEGRLDGLGASHRLLVGVDALRNRSDARNWDDGAATPLDVFSPTYGTFPEPAFDALPSTRTASRVRNVGVLLQDQMTFGERLIVVAGVRRDRARTDGDSTPSGGATTASTQADSATSKNLGVVYRAGDFSPYASYSESFEPLAGNDAAGAPFKPTRGKQVELGVKWLPAGSPVTASAAVYDLKEKNRLTTDPDNVNFSVQRGAVRVRGAEIEVAANLSAWDLIASWSYTDARRTDLSDLDAADRDQQLASIPRQQAALWALHRFGWAGLPSLRAGAGIRHAGRSGDGLQGGVEVPSATLLDLLVAYDTGPWRLALNVANATDRAYVATCLDRGDCWFGTRRKAVASVAYRW